MLKVSFIVNRSGFYVNDWLAEVSNAASGLSVRDEVQSRRLQNLRAKVAGLAPEYMNKAAASHTLLGNGNSGSGHQQKNLSNPSSLPLTEVQRFSINMNIKKERTLLDKQLNSTNLSRATEGLAP
uniref:Uncharacterized protein n=1 Tax=Citrifermentans bremense TaxID=60035 RepID=A0A6S6M7G6_9BACT